MECPYSSRSPYGRRPLSLFSPSGLGVELFLWAHGRGDLKVLDILNPDIPRPTYKSGLHQEFVALYFPTGHFQRRPMRAQPERVAHRLNGGGGILPKISLRQHPEPTDSSALAYGVPGLPKRLGLESAPSGIRWHKA